MFTHLVASVVGGIPPPFATIGATICMPLVKQGRLTALGNPKRVACSIPSVLQGIRRSKQNHTRVGQPKYWLPNHSAIESSSAQVVRALPIPRKIRRGLVKLDPMLSRSFVPQALCLLEWSRLPSFWRRSRRQVNGRRHNLVPSTA